MKSAIGGMKQKNRCPRCSSGPITAKSRPVSDHHIEKHPDYQCPFGDLEPAQIMFIESCKLRPESVTVPAARLPTIPIED